MPLENLTNNYRARVERALDQCLPAIATPPSDLHKALRYAVLGNGKRIRPVLVYATGVALGSNVKSLDTPACAVELIHAYSLIHDDLPAMDNDDLRRGKPTCHKAFGEAIAILAGDALQALAFQILAQNGVGSLDAGLRLRMVEILAEASGSRGMAGGQAMDLAALEHGVDLVGLEVMHRHKTGALIAASVMLGALSKPGIDDEALSKLARYGQYLGLSYQICDDILDVEGDTAVLGKQAGADLARNKPTYSALVGITRAKQRVVELHEQALECLNSFGTGAEPLRALSQSLVGRQS